MSAAARRYGFRVDLMRMSAESFSIRRGGYGFGAVG